MNKQHNMSFHITQIQSDERGIWLSGRCTNGPIVKGSIMSYLYDIEVTSKDNVISVHRRIKEDKFEIEILDIKIYERPFEEIVAGYTGALLVDRTWLDQLQSEMEISNIPNLE